MHLLAALSDAYLQVGVWVAAMIWICASLRERPQNRFLQLLSRPGLAPWVGAALGVSPGCGGAIVVMPLFVSGKTSFGAVIGTLVATMGDSSFVMLAARPQLGLAIHAGLFVLGGLCGTLVDALKIRPSTEPGPTASRGSHCSPCEEHLRNRATLDYLTPYSSHWTLAPVYAFFFVGLCLSISLSFFQVPIEYFGQCGPFSIVHLFGACGALQCMMMALVGGTSPKESKSSCHAHPRTAALEALQETAPVVGWVALSFLLTSIAIDGFGVDLSFLQENNLWCVLLGACIGLIPGCGPQIVLTTLYIDGVVGLGVLLANAVSQDGDALLPLLAKAPRAASLATLLTTLPAILVGVLVWALA